MVQLTSSQVWKSLGGEHFVVLGMVNANGHGRTVGVVYTVFERRLWFAAHANDWKVRHLRATPDVSATVVAPKRLSFLPGLRIPPSTITFQATATAHTPESSPGPVREALTEGIRLGHDRRGAPVIFELVPAGHFVTYGVGVSTLKMRDTETARGRVRVEP